MGLKDLAKNSPAAQRVDVMRSYMDVASVGLSFALAIVFGVGGGWWLDKQFGWSPWGVRIGLVLGIIAAVRNVVAVLRKYLK